MEFTVPNPNRNDVILVQWFPIEKRVGKYTPCKRKDDITFRKFQEEVHASDFNHESIIFVLENDAYSGIVHTVTQMENKINEFFNILYR